MARKKQNDPFKNLRRRAEEKLKYETIPLQRMSESDIAAVIHELKVHEIELQMQNEQLRQTQLELEESRERYSDLYDFAPTGYFVTDSRGMIVEANLAGASMLGVERARLIKKPLSAYVHNDCQDDFYRHRRAVLEKGGEHSCELKLVRKGGGIFVAQLQSCALKDNAGAFTECRTVMTDITGRKEAEEQIRRSRDEWELTFDAVPDLIAIVDTDYRIVRVNRAMAEQMGCRANEAVGLTCYEVVHGTDAPPEYCPHRVLMEDGRQHTAEVYEERLGGDFVISVTPLRNADGQITGSVHVAHNITERRAAEKELRIRNQINNVFLTCRDEQMYSELLELVLDTMQSKYGTFGYFDRAGHFVVPAMTREIYWEKCNVQEKDIIFKRGRFSGIWGRAVKEKKTFYSNTGPFGTPAGHIAIENTMVTPIIYKGEVISAIHVANKPGGYDEEDKALLEMMSRYIAPVLYARLEADRKDRYRRNAEAALQRALEQSRLRGSEMSALLAGARAVLTNREFADSARSIFDICKDLIGATAGYVALLSDDGTENDLVFLDAGGRTCTVDPALPMPVRGLRGEAYRTGKAVYDNDFASSEWMKFMPEGHASLDNVLFAPLTIEDKVVGLLGLANKAGGFTDNDAQLATAFGELAAVALQNSRALESLERSEQRFRSVAETASDAIVSIDSRGKVILWNRGAESTFGYSADEMIGKPVGMIMPERFRKGHEDGIEKILSTGKPSIVGGTAELAGLRKDGSEFPLELSLATWKAGEGVFFTAIIRDITERKRAEEALRDSEKQLSTRNRVAEIFLTTPDDQMYGEVLQVLLEAMESRYGIFGYVDEHDTLVIPSMTRDIWERCQVPDKTIVYPREKWGGIWGRALEQKRTLYANEGLQVPEGHVPITSVMVVPVLYGQRLIGLLEVANKPGDYTKQDQFFLENIAANIAPILNARLERDKQQRERRQAEEALRESEKKHRRLLETMNEGLGVTDADYFFTYVNDRFCQMLGYPREEILHRHLLEFIEDDYKQLMEDQITRRRKGESKSYEIGWRAKDGRVAYTLVSPAGQFDDNGNFVGSLGVLTDISERKEAEAQQQLASRILQLLNQEMALQELIHEVIALVKQATGFAAVGIRLREGDHYPYFEVDGFSADFVEAENDLCDRDEQGRIRYDAQGKPVLQCMCGRVLMGQTDVSMPFFTEGGSFWTNSTTKLLKSSATQDLPFTMRGHCNRAGYESVALIPMRSGAEIVGLLQLNDTWPGRFTEEMISFFERICGSVGIALARARAEEALKRSEERYALAQRAANIGSWDWNIISGALSWSEQIEPMFGFERGEFDGTYEAFLACLHPDDRAHVTDSVDACIHGGADYAIEHRIVWPDGTVRWVSETGDVVRDHGGRAVRMLGIVQDITERKQSEQLIENLAKFPAENPNPVLRIDGEGVVLFSNSAGLQVLAHWGCSVGQQAPPHWHQYIMRILKAGDNQELETECGDKIFSLLISPSVDAGYVNVYGTDITGRKEAEEDLRRYRQHLEELVQARTAELTEANERLMKEIEQRKQLERELLDISEREKRLIGQELHDSIGQQFTGIAFMTKVLERRLGEKSPEEAEGAAEIRALVNEAMTQTRALARGLHPVGLDAESLMSALGELADNTAHLFGIACSFDCAEPVPIHDSDVAVNLYRITQEAVTNAIKHGKAKSIRIELTATDKRSLLRVENDGVAFSRARGKKPGMGLQIMHHRAEMIGGSLDINKGGRGGTVVICAFPNSGGQT